MVDTKPLDIVRRKWEGAIGRVGAAYQEGVQATSGFVDKAVQGQSLYEEQMARKEVLQRRARELQKISDEDWKRGAREKGAARIGPGMQASKEKFGAGISEVLSTIQGVSLPPKTSDPATNVANRVTPIAIALSKLKER